MHSEEKKNQRYRIMTGPAYQYTVCTSLNMLPVTGFMSTGTTTLFLQKDTVEKTKQRQQNV